MKKTNTKFKQTELGLIPEDWEVRTIDQIKAKIKGALAMGPFGSNIKKEFFVGEGVPIIRGNNLNSYRFLDEDFVYLTEEKADELKSSNCKPGDVVVTHRGTLGQVGLIPRSSSHNRYVISQSGMKLSCDESQVINEYVFYFLKSPIGQRLLLRNTSQTGVPAIAQPLTSLRNMSLSMPDINEQKSIVKVLEDFNDKIDLMQKQNKTLEAIAQAIFKHWFNDFEFPNEEGKPYKSSGGEMVYSEKLKKKIPTTWEVNTIANEFNLVMGQSPPGTSYNETGYGVPFFQGRTDFGQRFPTIRMYTTRPTRFARKGDTLVSVRAPVGDVNLSLQDCCIGRGLAAIRHKSNSIPFTYSAMLNLKPSFDHFEAEGTVFGSIGKIDFETMQVLAPPAKVVELFESVVGPLDGQIEYNTLQLLTLSRIRDHLLPKLMSGKVRVPCQVG